MNSRTARRAFLGSGRRPPEGLTLALFSGIFFPVYNYFFAKVAELADAPDLGSGTERCGGSSPPFRIPGDKNNSVNREDTEV